VSPDVRVPVPVVVAVAGPVCAALLLLLACIAFDLSGESPLRYESPHNLAEAAGVATSAGVLRFLREGEDPQAMVSVRPEVISSAVTRVNALEAAIWGRQVRLIHLFDREGAIRDEGQRRYLACLAEGLNAAEIVAYLAPGGTSGCDSADLFRRIQERSR
jgi:hypothetical protein